MKYLLVFDTQYSIRGGMRAQIAIGERPCKNSVRRQPSIIQEKVPYKGLK